MNMENILIKHKDYEKVIEISSSIILGDLVEKLLSICNLLIYDIKQVNFKFKDNSITTIGDTKAPIDSNLESILHDVKEELDYIDVIPRDLSNKDNQFISLY